MGLTKFTIITVCFNAASVIEKTIRSVLGQAYSEIEYIIVDGASTDGTLDIIERYAGKDNRIRYVSEKDSGIYDAMNKGARMATGEYLNMLNAGDTLADKSVLLDIDKMIRARRGDIYYGNIRYHYPDGSESVRIYNAFCGRQFYYLLGDCINHQSIFAAKECFTETTFDTSLKMCADRDWMIRMHKAGKKYIPTGLLICDYSLDEGSASVKNEQQVWKENRFLVKKYYPVGYPIYFILDKIRNGKLSAKLLHKAYELVFLRGKNKK